MQSVLLKRLLQLAITTASRDSLDVYTALGIGTTALLADENMPRFQNHSPRKKSSITFSICVRVGLGTFATSNSYMAVFRMIQDFDRNTGRHNWQLSTGTGSDARRMKHSHSRFCFSSRLLHFSYRRELAWTPAPNLPLALIRSGFPFIMGPIRRPTDFFCASNTRVEQFELLNFVRVVQ